MIEVAQHLMTEQANTNLVVIERLAKVEQQVDSLTALLLPLVQDVHEIRSSIRSRSGFMAGIAATVSTIWVGVFAILKIMGALS